MTVVKTKYCAVKCMNTLCYDRLPNGACDIGEKSDTCLLNKSFNRVCELLKGNDVWEQVKGHKFKELLGEKTTPLLQL